MALSKTTKDHDEIQRWAEERGGKPAHVRSTESPNDIGILRLDFPGFGQSAGSSLEEISWDYFFEQFDERGRALVYLDETAGGERSNFNKLISGDSADLDDEEETPAASQSTGRGGSKRKTAAQGSSAKTVTKSAAKKAVKTPAKKASNVPAKKTAAKKAAAKKGAPAKAVKKSTAKKAVKTPAKKVAAKKAVKKTAKAAGPVKKTAAKKKTAVKTKSRR